MFCAIVTARANLRLCAFDQNDSFIFQLALFCLSPRLSLCLSFLSVLRVCVYVCGYILEFGTCFYVGFEPNHPITQ